MKLRLLTSTIVIVCTAFIIACTSNKTDNVSDVHVIPQPNSIIMGKGTFNIDNTIKISFININENEPIIGYIKEYFPKLTNRKIEVVSYKGNNTINFILHKDNKKEPEKESYSLNICNNKIDITANNTAGLFYGFQTLCQIITPNKDITSLPCLVIKDSPRFEWRGTHLDVSRHFFDIDFIKKYIDILAINKINKFHWHLTDDHGWRPQIDKYPKLTEIGAWRVDRSDVPWLEGEPPKRGEPTEYGGFYTKEQMADIVNYAKIRNIDVIPEIDIPGHSSAILAAYPELGCDDYPYYVQIGPYWPPKAILCAGNDKTLDFLYDIIDELIEVFPYEYIHIGGDEAFKDNWKVCPKCQKRIKSEKLANEEELQSWLIHKVEKHIISKGRKMIGWDEILEGGLSPTSTVMSWRGIDGGVAAAKAGNDVVMTPNTFCYFDYYQADACCQPKAIGGFLPLKTVYNFNPIPEVLSEQEGKHILGGQCNLWTEFINTNEHAEYMLLPRLGALAESVWTLPENKCWYNFQNKIASYKKNLKSWGYNYCEGSFKPIICSFSQDGKTMCKIESEVKDVEIYFTLDATAPSNESILYKEPFEIKESNIITAITYYEGKPMEIPVRTVLFKPILTEEDINIKPEPSEKYKGQGKYTLIDGMLGNIDIFNDGKWLGFQEDEITITIKNKEKKINSLSMNFLANLPNWIFIPPCIEVHSNPLSSSEKNRVIKGITTNTEDRTSNKIETINFKFDKPVTDEYIEIVIKNHLQIPDWHDAAGSKPWIFIDEIIVN